MRTITHKAVFAAAVAIGASVLAPQAAGAAPVGWGRCAGTVLDPRQECATLSVPLNYGDPGGRQIALEVSRVRTSGHRRGVLLLIPGGPGGSSLNEPSSVGAKLPASVRDSYDLVGFDPRGVGQSTPVSCGLSTVTCRRPSSGRGRRRTAASPGTSRPRAGSRTPA